MGKWRLLESEVVVDAPWLTVRKNRYETAPGKVLDDYYIVNREDFTLAVALTHGRLVLVRQYRPATDRFYLGLPSGQLEPGETPEEGAARELLEESGYVATRRHLIGELHPLPGYTRSAAFVVLFEVEPAETMGLGRPEIDPEIDDVLTVPFEEAVRMIARGEIDEMQAVAAILLARERLAEFGFDRSGK